MTDTQKLRHLISEKGWGLSTGACDVTERAPGARLGLQPNLGRVGGSEMDGQKDEPARELLLLCSALT